MKNFEIADKFRQMAKILEIKGDNPFRIRAYEKAAQNIESITEDITNYIKEDKLTTIPGIGKDLAEKIEEIVKTGTFKALQDLQKTIPEGLLDLLNIPSVGPKTAKLLYEKLKIKNISDLEKAIAKNKLEGLFGIKEKTIENISKGIQLLKREKERMYLAQAQMIAQEFLDALKKLPEVKNISVAGSLRRQKETVRDIDILVLSKSAQKVMDAFVSVPSVKEVIAQGETKSSLRTKEDIQVDCRVVEEKSYGAALLYFTGSKNFNIHLRTLAQKRGLKINEYGVFSSSKSGEKYLAGRTEEEIFKLLKMSFIPAELREDTGEIELAQEFKLPKLVELKDIKADLHIHSKYSDGANTIEEIALACQKRGYQYIAITDHSQSLKVAGGLSIKDLIIKKKEIEKINQKFKDFYILYGTEVDIDSDGNLDYPDKVLKEFDLVIAAIHTGFKQSSQQLTKRIIRACQNKYVHIIAHPTGRLFGVRDAYTIDFEQILKVAKETNTCLEINAFPQRLDLNDLNCRRAKEKGVKLAIGTDSHSLEQLEAIKFGLSVARRGWLSRNDIINTLGVNALLKTIKNNAKIKS